MIWKISSEQENVYDGINFLMYQNWTPLQMFYCDFF